MGAGAHMSGSCHCGAVRVGVRLSRSPAEIELRACQCSFCRRHGARTFADPAGHALIESASAADIRHYRFGQRTADFLICAECGVYIAAVIEGARRRIARLINDGGPRHAGVRRTRAVARGIW